MERGGKRGDKRKQESERVRAGHSVLKKHLFVNKLNNKVLSSVARGWRDGSVKSSG